MSKTVIACRNLHKSYFQGKHEVPVLHGVNLQLYEGELYSTRPDMRKMKRV